jgi:hypothetical protein
MMNLPCLCFCLLISRFPGFGMFEKETKNETLGKSLSRTCRAQKKRDGSGGALVLSKQAVWVIVVGDSPLQFLSVEARSFFALSLGAGWLELDGETWALLKGV